MEDGKQMIIDGFAISMYRSFGPDVQKIGPLNKINFFIGQNNSGKSNVLRFLREHFHDALRAMAQTTENGTGKYGVDGLDVHQGQPGKQTLGLYCSKNSEWYQNRLKMVTDSREVILPAFEKLSSAIETTHEMPGIWFLYTADTMGTPLVFDDELMAGSLSILSDREWISLARGLTDTQHSEKRRAVAAVFHKLTLAQSLLTTFPRVILIPAVRLIGDHDTTFGEFGTPTEDFSGLGIIQRLAQLQNPSHNEQHKKRQFEKINNFLQTIISNKSATIEIPYERNTINVHMDGRTLPLSSLGTGVHEVVILAAAATLVENEVFCLEEPEIHLHPILQKKLMNYLQASTNNQYFITTHSAHILDTPDAQIFHVRHQDGETTIDPVYTATGRSLICADLGYRASDLLQTNCVIWVEGPSDRIYINHWLKAVAADLIENIHYSIMPYGGRLLSHLSAEDPDVTEFISLRRLNRYITILMDSDRANEDASINETKQRIEMEFNKGPGFAWITKGREVENYIPVDTLGKSVKAVHKEAVSLAQTGQYEHNFFYQSSDGTTRKDADKVKVAHKVAEDAVALDILDLRLMVEKLVAFIRDANDDAIVAH